MLSVSVGASTKTVCGIGTLRRDFSRTGTLDPEQDGFVEIFHVWEISAYVLGYLRGFPRTTSPRMKLGMSLRLAEIYCGTRQSTARTSGPPSRHYLLKPLLCHDGPVVQSASRFKEPLLHN
jgi:hypothetical protein